MSAIASTIHSYRMPVLAGVALSLVLGLSGAKAVEEPAATTKKLQANAPSPQTPETHRRWYQIGRASWYGSYFQGKATASGESFDMNGLTCAHRSLPLGALIRVTNLHNHKSVVVRVNDRGPVPEDRVVDLSYAAAQTLGFSRRGIARVRLELLAQLEQPPLPTVRP